MAHSTVIGPQFGGRAIRAHLDQPKPSKLLLRRMSTGDLKVAQAILSEEIRIAFASFKARLPRVSTLGEILTSIPRHGAAKHKGPLEREIEAMKAQLSKIGDEITRRNLRDLKAGRINWTRPRHPRRELSVSLAEAARVI